MGNIWSSIIPLALGSAIVPVQIIITILLLRSSSGRFTAVAWVAGMSTVRLAQGAIFGLVISNADDVSSGNGGNSGVVAGIVLLLLAILMYVAAAKQYRKQDDPDGPPPKWLTMSQSLTPGTAFMFGAGIMLIGAKFWVFTLSAIAEIGDANLGRPQASLAFLGFAVLAVSTHLALVGTAYLAPKASESLLERMQTWLEVHSRVIMIGVGVVFGTWFLIKGLTGLGVI